MCQESSDQWKKFAGQKLLADRNNICCPESVYSIYTSLYVHSARINVGTGTRKLKPHVHIIASTCTYISCFCLYIVCMHVCIDSCMPTCAQSCMAIGW